MTGVRRGGCGGQPKATRRVLGTLSSAQYASNLTDSFRLADALPIADRIKPMPQVGFNPKAIGVVVRPQDGDVCRPLSDCAFRPVVVMKPGIEAIMEGLRLANIKGFIPPRTDKSA